MSGIEVIARRWLTVDEVRQMSGEGRTRVYEALQTGELVGSQRTPRGKWRIHVDAVESWMRGEKIAS